MTTRARKDVHYPESDGKPMADNTLQFQWIVRIQGNLDDQYRDDPNVLVVGDLLWYAVRGDPTACTAPDTMVVFGRPKGYRGSYLQWREEDIAPQVVFEILSPNNTEEEMDRKRAFFERHGVEEYYLYDPDRAELFGWLRRGRRLRPITQMDGWRSPRLNIRFDLSHDELVIYKANGQPFLSFVELAARAEELQREAELAQRQSAREKRQREKAEREVGAAQREIESAQREVEAAHREIDNARRLADDERKRANQLAERLRELGINPDDLEDPNR